jgi:predicted small lipoprotein YifL
MAVPKAAGPRIAADGQKGYATRCPCSRLSNDRRSRINMPIPAIALILGLLMAGAVVAGCGQKGPLYLPEDPEAAQMQQEAGDPDEEAEAGDGY